MYTKCLKLYIYEIVQKKKDKFCLFYILFFKGYTEFTIKLV